MELSLRWRDYGKGNILLFCGMLSPLLYAVAERLRACNGKVSASGLRPSASCAQLGRRAVQMVGACLSHSVFEGKRVARLNWGKYSHQSQDTRPSVANTIVLLIVEPVIVLMPLSNSAVGNMHNNRDSPTLATLSQ